MQTKIVKPTKAKKALKTRKKRSSKLQSARLDIRLDRKVRTLIEKAALITGQTVTDFATSNLALLAMETIERYERLTLSDRDRDRFLAALDRPAKPLPALAKAARRHAQATKGE